MWHYVALVHGGKWSKTSAPKLPSRHSDRGGFHDSDHTIQVGDLDHDLAALRTECARSKLPAVETFDAADAGFNQRRQLYRKHLPLWQSQNRPRPQPLTPNPRIALSR